jgi:hypothetical protein
MKGTGTLTRRGDTINGVLTFRLPDGDVIQIDLSGERIGDGMYSLQCDAVDHLLRLAEGVLGGSVSRVMG